MDYRKITIEDLQELAKIYAETFVSQKHLENLIEEAKGLLK